MLHVFKLYANVEITNSSKEKYDLVYMKRLLVELPCSTVGSFFSKKDFSLLDESVLANIVVIY